MSESKGQQGMTLRIEDLEMNGRMGRVDGPGRKLGTWTDGGRHRLETLFNGREVLIVGFVGREERYAREPGRSSSE
jgi:hypothetical protein